ncbi:MAG: hypothetical protein ACTSWY_01995 [Promethearchaeota archaeon]
MQVSGFLSKLNIPRSERVYYPSDDSFLFLDYLDTKEFETGIFKLLSEKKQRSFRNGRKKYRELPIMDLSAMDMGCGTGVLGYCIAFKLLEFKGFNIKNMSVFFADKNPYAVKLTRKTVSINNSYLISRIKGVRGEKKGGERGGGRGSGRGAFFKNQFGVEFKYAVSDLFENVPSDKKFDLIVFNAPYLPSEPELINKVTKKEIDLSWDGENNKGNKVLIEFFKQLEDRIYKHTEIFFITSSHADVGSLLLELESLRYNVILLQNIHKFFEDIILYRIKQNLKVGFYTQRN